MNFELSQELRAVGARARDFIAEQVIRWKTMPGLGRTARTRTCGASWWRAPALPAC